MIILDGDIWGVGDSRCVWLSGPSLDTSSFPPPSAAAATAAAAPDQSEARHCFWRTKLSKLNCDRNLVCRSFCFPIYFSSSPPSPFSLREETLVAAFLLTKTYLSKERWSLVAAKPPSAPFQVRPCAAFEPARCCVAAAKLSGQSWDQSAENAPRISLRGATWLVPRSKKWWVESWELNVSLRC